MGVAKHADDLRTSAPSVECVASQDEIKNKFSAKTCLQLDPEIFEIVKIYIGNRDVPTTESARCLGVWWNSRLTAKESVNEPFLALIAGIKAVHRSASTGCCMQYPDRQLAPTLPSSV